MTAPRNFVAPVCLAVLGALSAGAIVFSVLTAPPAAETHLHQAARATVAASGFELQVVQGQGPGQRPSAAVDYRAPDQVVIGAYPGSGGGVEVAIGAKAWVSLDGGKTWRTITSGPKPGAALAEQVLALPRALAKATGVSGRGDHLRVDATGSELLQAVGDASGHLPADVTVRLDVTIADGVLKTVTVTVRGPGRPPSSTTFRYSRVGDAPPVKAPATGSVAG